jgi:hypothetical protein
MCSAPSAKTFTEIIPATAMSPLQIEPLRSQALAVATRNNKARLRIAALRTRLRRSHQGLCEGQHRTRRPRCEATRARR